MEFFNIIIKWLLDDKYTTFNGFPVPHWMLIVMLFMLIISSIKIRKKKKDDKDNDGMIK